MKIGAVFTQIAFLRSVVSLAFTTILALPVSSSYASGTIKIDEDKSVSLGLGFRTSFTSAEKGAPDGIGRSKNFNLDSARLYIGGQLNSTIKGTLNTELNNSGSGKVIDAIAQFEPSDEFNIWMGRMLPPSDRANLDGPYYALPWSYPGLVSQYPSLTTGRDNGVTVWGKVMDKKLVYSVGTFNGHNNMLGESSEKGNLLFAGRVAFNFWDAEPAPAYYTGSTYYGSVDILTVALATMRQKDGVGTATAKGNYNAWNVDALMEKKLAEAGVITVEGAYYSYDTQDVADTTTVVPGANVGGITQGKAILAGVGYLLPGKFSGGQLQPHVRYQKFNRDAVPTITELSTKQLDIGINYLISGSNAKISATYTKLKDNAAVALNTNSVVVGVQLQF